jgi:hypothetical protein
MKIAFMKKLGATELGGMLAVRWSVNENRRCCHLMQNLLSFSFLSTNIKIKIYRTIILPRVFYGCETWSVTLKEEHGLRVLC